MQRASEDLANSLAGFATTTRSMAGVQDGPDLEMGFLLAVGVPLYVAGAGIGTVAYCVGAVGHGGLRWVASRRGILVRSATWGPMSDLMPVGVEFMLGQLDSEGGHLTAAMTRSTTSLSLYAPIIDAAIPESHWTVVR